VAGCALWDAHPFMKGGRQSSMRGIPGYNIPCTAQTDDDVHSAPAPLTAGRCAHHVGGSSKNLNRSSKFQP